METAAPDDRLTDETDLVGGMASEILLAELAADCLPDIEPGEVTAGMLERKTGYGHAYCERLLSNKVKAGELTCREVRSNGRRAKAYRRVT